MRAMSGDELDKFLGNWSRWARNCADCYPQGYGAAGIEAEYRCPQRWHYGTEAALPLPVYPVQAEAVEHVLHGTQILKPWYRAVASEWVHLPGHTLAAQRIAADQWAHKRAYKAGMALRTYIEAGQRARHRLASILAPMRGQLP